MIWRDEKIWKEAMILRFEKRKRNPNIKSDIGASIWITKANMNITQLV